jgi:hypothetical protein
MGLRCKAQAPEAKGRCIDVGSGVALQLLDQSVHNKEIQQHVRWQTFLGLFLKSAKFCNERSGCDSIDRVECELHLRRLSLQISYQLLHLAGYFYLIVIIVVTNFNFQQQKVGVPLSCHCLWSIVRIYYQVSNRYEAVQQIARLNSVSAWQAHGRPSGKYGTISSPSRHDGTANTILSVPDEKLWKIQQASPIAFLPFFWQKSLCDPIREPALHLIGDAPHR